jgi:hypothetical protein
MAVARAQVALELAIGQLVPVTGWDYCFIHILVFMGNIPILQVWI